MTAGADRSAAGGRRRSRSFRGSALPIIAGLLVTCAGCTNVNPQAPAAAGIPLEDLQAVRSTVQKLNSTSAGPVAVQQAVLRELVDPSTLTALADCPPATTTVRFEPVYPGLRPIADTGADDPASTRYALPALIRVYTGNRITGTDLTTLQLDVRQNATFITPICVG